MDLKPWKILKFETAFKNKWWDIVQEMVELPDGSIIEDFFVSRHPGSAVILALTESNDVVVRRQYKHGCREIVTELPIGALDASDADFVDAAKRELLEETGYGSGVWEAVGTLVPNPTSSTSRVHVFLARGVRKVAEAEVNPREEGETSLVAPAELMHMVASGQLKTSAAVGAIFLAAERLGWIEARV